MTDTDRIEYDSSDEANPDAPEEWDELADDDFGVEDVDFFDWLNNDSK